MITKSFIRKLARQIRLANSPLSRNPNLVLLKYDPDGIINYELRVVNKKDEADQKESFSFLINKKKMQQEMGIEAYLDMVSLLDKLVLRWHQSDTMTYKDALSDIKKFSSHMFKPGMPYSIREGKISYEEHKPNTFTVKSPTVQIKFGETTIQAKFGNDYLVNATYERALGSAARTKRDSIDKFIESMKERESELRNMDAEDFTRILKKHDFNFILTDLRTRQSFKPKVVPWASSTDLTTDAIKEKWKAMHDELEKNKVETGGKTINPSSDTTRGRSTSEDKTRNFLPSKKNPDEDKTKNVMIPNKPSDVQLQN